MISKFNNLCFYDAPSWQDKDGAGFVDAGEGFVIDGKLNVSSSLQFKVHNSIGKTYYITINEVYVYVR
ncbi:N-acetylmuramoyl-L-alanine amidase [Bacillus cereus]|nr:N-acetylmuramoyl-L-alanine amidase [Bacillus cereus]